MPDCGHFEAYDVCFVDLRLAMEAEEDRLIHMGVTSLLLYFPRPVSEVSVEAYSCLASQQASSHLDVVWEAVVVAQHDYHYVLASGVLQVAATAVVGPCSQVEALWQMLAGDERENRKYSPYPTCHSNLLGMDDTPSLPRPRAAQAAPTYPCLGSHRPLATLAGRPEAPIV